MAKFVCDFETVIAAGEDIISTANDTLNSVSNYSSKIESNLSSWEGSAKTSFQSTCNDQVTIAKANAEYAQELGEFIKSSAQAIQSLEEQLSGLSI